jgi:hypothetical protein
MPVILWEGREYFLEKYNFVACQPVVTVLLEHQGAVKINLYLAISVMS